MTVPFTTRAVALVAALLLLPGSRHEVGAQENGTPTRLLVRAVANDAKVLGTGVGGARITVRDAATGEVLAEGVQEGGTGDTRAIMAPRERGARVYDRDGTAGFEAVLDLSAPTRVRVEAEGPLGTPHAVQSAAATLLVLPGVDVLGEGLVLVLHGFTVKLERPRGEGPFAVEEVPVRVDVTMLCGCTIEPGGLWDADRLTVTAQLVREGRVVVEAPLGYGGEIGIFEGRIRPPGPGRYELRVTAVDAERANAGMVTREIAVRR